MSFFEVTFCYGEKPGFFEDNHCIIEADNIEEAIKTLGNSGTMRDKHRNPSAVKEIKEVYYVYSKEKIE